MGVFTFGRKSQWPKVLKWINEKRELLGLEPLREVKVGIRKSSTECPIARSLSNGHTVGVGATFTKIYNENGDIQHQWPNPLFIQDFIVEFDRGRIPSLG